MQALEKIRLSDEQEARLDMGEMITIPASWEEFEDFLIETDHRVEYHNEQIIVMGLARLIHEFLVIRLGYLLAGYYLSKPFYIAGSNAGIRKDGKRRHYNGDLLVIKGKPEFQGKSRSIITNPYLIVEILSESTLNYDLGAKRRRYEEMETVQEIVFVDPLEQQVQVCKRTDKPNVWMETTYSQPTEIVSIDGFQIQLSEIFTNLPEEE
jgi:Uma2 family endonuclease